MDEDDDDEIYGVAPPGKVLSSSETALGSVIVKLQTAYELHTEKVIGKEFKLSENGKKSSVWTTIARQVSAIGADPTEWVRAQFEVGSIKRPYASHMAGDKALANYKFLVGTVYNLPEKAVVNAPSASLAEEEMNARIDSLRMYLKLVTGSDDPDSLNVMLYIDDRQWGIDGLALLMVCTEDMYLPLFAEDASKELKWRPDLMRVCAANYKENLERLNRYVNRQNSGV